MTLEIKVPALGESVSEATIAKLYKAVGESVKTDELLVELETDKVTLEVNAPSDGVISDLKVQEGDNVEIGDLIAILQEGATASAAKPAAPAPAAAAESTQEIPLSPAPKKIVPLVSTIGDDWNGESTSYDHFLLPLKSTACK